MSNGLQSTLTGIQYGRLQRVTIPDAVIIQFVLLKMSNGLQSTLTGILYGRLQRVTIPDAVIIQFVLLKMSNELQSTLNRHTVRLFAESDDTRCFNNTICPP